MPERPGPWDLLDRSSDPVVADVPEVDARLAYFRRLAGEMRTEGERLHRIASGESLKGKYADELRSSAGDVARDMDQVVGRYEAVVSALTEYRPALDTALRGSSEALDEAIDADSARKAAEAMPEATAPEGKHLTPQQEQANSDKSAATDAAAGRLEAAKAKLDGVLSALDSAGQAAAAVIRKGFDDGLTDSGWDRFKYAFKKFLQVLVKVLTYVGMALAVIALVIPGVGELVLAAGLAIGAVTLAADVALKAMGDGSWADIGIAIAGLVTFGAAKVLGPAIQAGLKSVAGAVKGVTGAGSKVGEGIGSGAATRAADDLDTIGKGSPGQKAAGDAHEDGSSGATDDPVDVVTGEMFLPQRDLALPGVLPLVLDRRYGSAYQHGGYFGAGWASTLDQRVVTAETEIRLGLEDGRILHYPVPGGSAERVMPSHGPRWPLCWDRDSDTVTVEQGDLGRTLHFPLSRVHEMTRPLTAITDRAGNEISFDRDEEGILVGVRHSGGYHVKVSTQPTPGGARVTSLSLADPAGGEDLPVREFRYDIRGRLTGVVNESGLPLTFDYDDQGRITRWEDRNGYEYRYTYRADGRVVRGEGSGGFLDVTLDYDLDERTTTVTDALGHATVHHWNDRLQVYKVVNPLGHESRTERDLYGHVLAVTDQQGHTTMVERDAYGDPTLVTRPEGSTVSVSYNDARQPVSATGPDGGTWTYEYGSCGRLTAACDPAGAVTRYDYDNRGLLTAIIDAQGQATVVRCDSAGLPVEVSDPLGSVTRYWRDAFGRVNQVAGPLGEAARLDWADDGRPGVLTRPDGASETWEYDPEGNLVRHTDPAGQVTSYEYGPFDLPVQRSDPDGAVYRFAYTPQLRLESVTSSQGQVWRYEYDPAGNLVAETDFNGARREYVVDAVGRLAARVNQAGQRTTFKWDVAGRLVERVIGPDLYRYAYDSAGRLARAEGPGVLLDYDRDATGRVVAETVNGRVLHTQYDPAGRRTSRVTPRGTESTWEYDEVGHVTRFHAGEETLEFTYDSAGNEISRRLGSGAVLTQSFDIAGRIKSQGILGFDDSANSWSSIQGRSCAYGPSGLPVEIRDQLHGTRQFELDPMGRVSRVQGAEWRESYAYDSLGNISAARTRAANLAEEELGDCEIEGTLLRRSRNTRYEYDEAGRLARKVHRTLSGQVRVWTYEWNSEDQLVSVATPSNGKWRYTYDPLGRRVAKQRLRDDAAEPGGRVAVQDVTEEVWFSWDGPRVAEEIRVDPDGRASVLTWDYRPDDFTPVTQISRTLENADGQREADREFFAIVTDLVGTPRELVTPGGEVAWHAVATVWGETVAASSSEVACPLRFPGQYHDDETGLNYNLNRYYDPATGRYLSIDPLGLVPGPNPSMYVDNPYIESDPLGLAPYTQVEYGGDNLSQIAIQFRNDKNLPAGRNAAVYEYRGTDGSLKYHVGLSDGMHAERLVGKDLVERLRVDFSRVTRIYTELEPCGPGYHNCYAWLDRNAANIPVSYSFRYGPDSQGRTAGMNLFRRAENLAFWDRNG